MLFIINALLSVLYFLIVGHSFARQKLSYGAFAILFFPVAGVWLLICGGQYGVGTDYYSYFEIFSGEGLDTYKNKGELLFYYIVTFLNKNNIRGQALFYLFYGINFLFLSLIVKRIDCRSLFIFILLYFTVSNLFNNQLNVLRQTTALYIGTYAVMLLTEQKIRNFLVWVALAGCIHVSAFSFVFFYVFKYIKKVSIFQYKFFLLFCFLGGIFFKLDWLNYISADLIPEFYIGYLQEGHIQENQLLMRLTKYIYIPFYWASVHLIKEKKLSGYSLFMFNIGFFSFCCRLLLLNISIVSRLADSFILLSMFPFFYYLEDLYMNKKYFWLAVCSIVLLGLYFVKTVLFPSGEYLYQSIYF